MNDTYADACSETKKLPNLSNNLLNMMWKMMQEEKKVWRSQPFGE